MKMTTLGRKLLALFYSDASACDNLHHLTNEFLFQYRTVRATFLQHFGIAGGPNGLMNRGEEVVQINILHCSSSGLPMQPAPPDTGLSPRALAGSLTRKLRRKESQPDANTTPPSKRTSDL